MHSMDRELPREGVPPHCRVPSLPSCSPGALAPEIGALPLGSAAAGQGKAQQLQDRGRAQQLQDREGSAAAGQEGSEEDSSALGRRWGGEGCRGARFQAVLSRSPWRGLGERLLDNWIFYALPNEPIKIQPIWFAYRNFAFKNLLSYFLLSPYQGVVISKEKGAVKQAMHMSALFRGFVTLGDFA